MGRAFAEVFHNPLTKTGLGKDVEHAKYFNSPDEALAEGNRNLAAANYGSPNFSLEAVDAIEANQPGVPFLTKKEKLANTLTGADSRPSPNGSPFLTAGGTSDPAAHGIMVQPEEEISPDNITPFLQQRRLTVSNPGVPKERIVRPDFNEAYDREGFSSPGLTKTGKALGFASRFAAAAAAGAGSKTFGQGFERAVAFSDSRRKERDDARHDELQNKLLENQVEDIPFLKKYRQSQIDRADAQTDYYTERAESSKIVKLGGVAFRRSSDGSLVPMAGEADEEKTLPGRQRIAEDNPELFDGEADKNDYIRFGTRPRAQRTKNRWDSYRAANGNDDQAAIDAWNQDHLKLRQAGRSGRGAEAKPGSDAIYVGIERDKRNAERTLGSRWVRQSDGSYQDKNGFTMSGDEYQKYLSDGQRQIQKDYEAQIAAAKRQETYRMGRGASGNASTGRKITTQKALEYLQEAGGDRDRAEQLAEEDGWEW